MKLAILCFAVSTVASGAASAACFGSDAFSTCNDESGNTYSVHRFGNTTVVDGYNPGTGSSWNQTSTTFGNTTHHNGTSADGGDWNMTQQQIGGSTYYNGSNSDGEVFSYSCDSYGNCY